MYQRLAAAHDESRSLAVREELLDRFGPPPEEVERLFEMATFRQLVRSVGLEEVVLQGAKVRLAPVELPESATMRLNRLYPGTIVKPDRPYHPGTKAVDCTGRRDAAHRRPSAGVGDRPGSASHSNQRGSSEHREISRATTHGRRRLKRAVLAVLAGCGTIKAGSAAIVGDEQLSQV